MTDDEPTGPGDSREIVMEIPARTEFVSFVRVVIATSAELEPNMDPERIDDLRVAVSEATTNAIEAHVHNGADDRIRIVCNLADDQVSVLIHDEGIGFEPDRLPELPPPESPERLLHENGLGVPLMRLLADEAEIISDEGGTDVRLVVYSTRRRRRS